LGPEIKVLDVVSEAVEEAVLVEAGKDKLNGTLFFLKIEGDKHFLPSSKSLISCRRNLFFASFSMGTPFLYLTLTLISINLRPFS
jgi:hypothetical protein